MKPTWNDVVWRLAVVAFVAVSTATDVAQTREMSQMQEQNAILHDTNNRLWKLVKNSTVQPVEAEVGGSVIARGRNRELLEKFGLDPEGIESITPSDYEELERIKQGDAPQ